MAIGDIIAAWQAIHSPSCRSPSVPALSRSRRSSSWARHPLSCVVSSIITSASKSTANPTRRIPLRCSTKNGGGSRWTCTFSSSSCRPNKFDYGAYENEKRLNDFIQRANIGGLFNLVEFFVRHPGCSGELKGELADAFVTARAAYRVFDNKYIAAIGTEEQAAAFERAIADAEAKNATAARKQLIAAGVALRNSDWPGSVRESIHAVEAIAVRLAPGTDTLGAALKVLEQRGHLHGSLKAAFGSLYGYSSDEEGVRHALVFGDEAQVDEADALFMLGACASFVSYLLARGT